jgi:hypothetical protein
VDGSAAATLVWPSAEEGGRDGARITRRARATAPAQEQLVLDADAPDRSVLDGARERRRFAAAAPDGFDLRQAERKPERRVEIRDERQDRPASLRRA